VLLLMFFLSLIPRPHSSPLFPYTTLFRSALGAYLGALFNLNPLLDRDGYHILVDLLRQPGLRARSRRRLQLRLAGRTVPDDLPLQVGWYAVAALGWLLGCACFAILMSTRYYHVLVELTGR